MDTFVNVLENKKIKYVFMYIYIFPFIKILEAKANASHLNCENPTCIEVTKCIVQPYCSRAANLTPKKCNFTLF